MVAPAPQTDGARGFRGLFVVCAALETSVAFYLGLGFELQNRTQRSAVIGLKGALELHLHEKLSRAEEQAYGVCWQAGTSGLVLLFTCADLDGLWRRAPESARLVRPVETPWGDRIAILLDPDGYRLEFRQEVW